MTFSPFPFTVELNCNTCSCFRFDRKKPGFTKTVSSWRGNTVSFDSNNFRITKRFIQRLK